MVDLSSLPDTLASLFGETAEGDLSGRFYSAVDAREVERALAEYGISYRTRIVRSRKRGTYYRISLLEGTDDMVCA